MAIPIYKFHADPTGKSYVTNVGGVWRNITDTASIPADQLANAPTTTDKTYRGTSGGAMSYAELASQQAQYDKQAADRQAAEAPSVTPPATTSPTAFRPRNANEDLSAYLKAKQDYEIAQTGKSTVDFGTPAVAQPPTPSAPQAGDVIKAGEDLSKSGKYFTRPSTQYPGSMDIYERLQSGAVRKIELDEFKKLNLNAALIPPEGKGAVPIGQSPEASAKQAGLPGVPTGGVAGAPTYDKQTEIKNVNTDANDTQEKELALIESETSKVDLSKSASLVAKLTELLESDKGAPTPVPMAQKFAEERAKLGINDLENTISQVDAKLAQLDADYASATESEAGRLVSMTQVQRRQSAEGIQYNAARRDLVAERNSIATQLNTKYGVVESIMKYAGLDYDNAQQDYQFKFNAAVSLTNLIKGIESGEKSDQERKIDNARANLQVTYNLLKDGNVSYAGMDESTKLNIKNMEIQAGFPVGFTKFVSEAVDTPITHFGTAFTDASGNRIQPVITTDKKTGALSVKNIDLGKAGAGTGDTPSSYDEWTLAGGQAGTGKTYADFIASKTSDTQAETIQKTIDSFNKDLAGLKSGETREILIARLKAQYGTKINPDDIVRKVYETYSDEVAKKLESGTTAVQY